MHFKASLAMSSARAYSASCEAFARQAPEQMDYSMLCEGACSFACDHLQLACLWQTESL